VGKNVLGRAFAGAAADKDDPIGGGIKAARDEAKAQGVQFQSDVAENIREEQAAEGARGPVVNASGEAVKEDKPSP
jgi:hypothetical protein